MYIKQYLRLIKLVNDSYEHIQQLESLITLLRHENESVWLSKEQIEHLYLVAKTTFNSHYDYRAYTSPEFQVRDNHVDVQINLSN